MNNFANSLAKLLETNAELMNRKTILESSGGYNLEFHCWDEIKAFERAMEEFKDELNTLIDDRVNHILAKHYASVPSNDNA